MPTSSSPPSAAASPKAAVTPVLTAGLTRYELVRSLGQDHHGELLLMRQRFSAGPGGYAVVKQLNPVTREEDWHRLQEEARLVTQLHHPNIIAAYQLNGSAGRPLLLMEYVEGLRLDALRTLAEAASRPLSEGLACYVAAEVAEALHYAHAFVDDRGRPLRVVHRDVTPHNLLVGLQGEVKLLGFGVAWSQLSGRMSTEGADFQGSLAYASPEHAGLQELDGRSDLFSLGVVLLELLTGRHLFDAQARFAAELRWRQRRVRRRALPAMGELGHGQTQALLDRIRGLQAARVEQASRTVSERLRPLLHKLLAPRREERYATGAELSSALREYLWDTGCRFGRPELKQEVASLTEAAAALPRSRTHCVDPPGASTLVRSGSERTS